MKNYVKDSQKLPMFGVGPYLVGSLGVLTLAGMLLSGNILKSGMLGGFWVIIFRVIGTLIILSGLMCHNWWLIVIQIINWGIMTIVLKNTEEKWLENLYVEEYMEYKSQVNRCILWFPRKK